jgi:hypothetical protein
MQRREFIGIQRHRRCYEDIRTLSPFSFRSGVQIQGVPSLPAIERARCL